jgi:isopenicillin N synthase-like dioxygenase
MGGRGKFLGVTALPVVDVSELVGTPGPVPERVAREIGAACRDSGFFYVTGHGVAPDLLARLDSASREFFRLPEAAKLEIAMARGGPAWRGFFPVGGELTAGRPDLKEGLYFGAELGDDDPRVRAGLPLHGRNLFPRQVPRLREAVLSYMDALTGVAQAVLRGVAASLDLDAGYFESRYTADPTVLFRVFHYPPAPAGSDEWGVGEHTDYGLLTLLAQDDNGGLQVHAPPRTLAGTDSDKLHGRGWVDAPPIPGTFVCNIGDMLDRMTDGWYRSTPHRVRNASGRDRLSYPFFFDPDFSAEVPALPGRAATAADGAFQGTYGEYLVSKVAKVFPELAGWVRG